MYSIIQITLSVYCSDDCQNINSDSCWCRFPLAADDFNLISIIINNIGIIHYSFIISPAHVFWNNSHEQRNKSNIHLHVYVFTVMCFVCLSM